MDKNQLTNIKEQINAAEVLSFDVFDTLLLRVVDEPEAIFDHVGNYYGLADFRAFRIKMQNEASELATKEHGWPHPTFDGIYDYIESLDTTPYDSVMQEQNISWTDIKNLELTMELDALIANPEIKAVYDYAKEQKKRIVATTDMYLDTGFVQKALEKNGYELHAIYDSADIHKTKWVGDLFEHVIGVEDVSSAHIVHIGDNPSADCAIPKEFGINAIHYEGDKGIRGLCHPEHNCHPEERSDEGSYFWHTLGARVGGPLYLGLMQWLNSKMGACDKPIYFMSRDGYNLYKLYEQFTDVDVHYMYTSRRALLLAGITGLDDVTLGTLPPFTHGQTVRDVLDYLDMTDIYADCISEVGYDNLDDPISEEDVVSGDFRKIYRLREKDFLGKCEMERQNAAAYLRSIGFYDGDSIVFDCGWNGSSQFLLDRLLDASGYEHTYNFYYTGILDTDKSRMQLNKKEFEAYLFDYDHNHVLQDRVREAIVLLELFFGSPEPSVYRYGDTRIRDTRGRFYCIKMIQGDGPSTDNTDISSAVVFDTDTNDTDTTKQSLLDGISDYMSYAYPFATKYHIDTTRNDAIAELMRFIEDPTLEEATIVGNLSNDDTFAKREGVDVKLAYITREQYESGVNIDTFWIQGFLKRDDIDDDLKKQICEDKQVDEDIIKRLAPQLLGPLGTNATAEDLTPEERAYRAAADRAGYEARPYTRWFNLHYRTDTRGLTAPQGPLISVVIPVYNVEDKMLRECIDSVINQTYPNWELILVDDFSTMESVRDVLREYESKYGADRDNIGMEPGSADNNNTVANTATPGTLHVIYRTENGHISKATNDGIFVAAGEFIAFMDCDDLLELTALEEMVGYLNEHPETDFIYSDEDKISEEGSLDTGDFHNPFFKPDWSPDTFMSMMYTNHLAMYRRELVVKTGGLRTEFNGSQDYDFTMRFMELSDNKRVGHVPRVLYHWRERQESVASGMGAKPYVISAMQRLKEETLKRRGIEGTVHYDEDVFQHRVDYTPVGNPLVSIIIPSKDNYYMLTQCLESVQRYTAYPNYEVIVVDNGSTDDNKKSIGEWLQAANDSKTLEQNYTYIYEPMTFNFSKMCNIGAQNAKGEYLLFLNDDVEAINPNWLGKMVGHAMQKHTGAVGAKLLYPNSNRIQHLGIANLEVGPCHMYMGSSDVPIFYFGRNRMVYDWLAVTGACLMVSAKKFNEVATFDENLTVAYNDVDLCFNLYEAGYYNVVRPDVSLYHHESFSRGYDDISEEKKKRLKRERNILYDKHPDLFARDPFHNVNFGVDRIDYDINMYGVGVHNYDVKKLTGDYAPKPSPLNVGIDEILKDDMVRIRGWAFSDNPQADLNAKRYVILKNQAGEVYACPADTMPRADISEQFDTPNLTEGFEVNIDRKLLATHIYAYDIGVLQVNSDGTETYTWSADTVPHDGIEEVPGKCYTRTLPLSDIQLVDGIMGSIDEVTSDTRVVTKYGSFNDMTYLKGWAFKLGTNAADYRIEIGVCYPEPDGHPERSACHPERSEGSSLILYDTHRLIRYDVADAITDGMSYLCGFATEIPLTSTTLEACEVYMVLTNMITGEHIGKKVDIPVG